MPRSRKKKSDYKLGSKPYWVKIARLDTLHRVARLEKRAVRRDDIAEVLGVHADKIAEPPAHGLTDYYIAKVLGINYDTAANVRRGLPSFAREAKVFVHDLSDTSRTGLSYFDAIKDKKKQLAEARGVAAELFKRGLWSLTEKQLITGLRLGEFITVEIGGHSYNRPKLQRDPDLFEKMRQLVQRALDGEPRLTAAKNLGFPYPAGAAEALDYTMLKGERTFMLNVTKNDETVQEKVAISLLADLCIATPDEYDELQLLRPRRRLRKLEFGSKWKMTVGGPCEVDDEAARPAILFIIEVRLKEELGFDKIAEELKRELNIKVSRRIVQNVLEDRHYRKFSPLLWDAAHETPTGKFRKPETSRIRILWRLEERKDTGTSLSELAEAIGKPASSAASYLARLEAEGKVFKTPGHRGRWYLTKAGQQHLETHPEEHERTLQTEAPEILG